MNWYHVLGWGSPVGLGAFFVGLGTLLKGLMHGKNGGYGKHEK
jgi:hypothetical protein